TTPTNAWPMVIGTGIVFCAQACQLYMCTSVPQIDGFVTWMSTSSTPTVRTGTSSSHSPGSARLFTTACIVFCTRKKLGESGKKEKLDSSLVGRGDCTARDGICVLQQIRLRSRA